MFAKLLKYDMRRTARIGIPLIIVALILIGVGVANGLFSCALTDFMNLDFGDSGSDTGEYTEPSKFVQVIGTILAITIVLAMLLTKIVDLGVTILLPILFTVMFIINLVNFYISLITDEGYLTFTLPVKPVSILGSKFLNASIWNLSIGLIAVLGVFLTKLPNSLYSIAMILKTVPWDDIGEAFNIITQMFGFDGLNPLNLLLTIILALVMSLVLVLAQQVFFFFTIYLGGVVAKKRKLLAGAGFSIAGYYLFYIIEQILVWIILICCFTPLFFIGNLGGIVVANFMLLILNLILFLTTIILIGAIFLFFFLTNLLMTKKLNLP